MKFRTEIKIEKSSLLIRHQNRIMTMGSCFAENIAEQLSAHFFKIIRNPYGILYNPLSITLALEQIIKKKKFKANELFFYQDEWHSFWHHSSFSHHKKNQVLKKINEQIDRAHQFLKHADWLILTFGTAYVYFHLPEKQLVSNCHKLPQKEFRRELISVDEIVQTVQTVFQELKAFNPKLKIIISISPIRHIRDGLVQNQRSKATLILAVQRLLETHPSLIYFPAYEILMDDLRDYRFYELNLTHPNSLAIHYIWEKFSEMFFNEETQNTLKQFARLRNALDHKVRNPYSESHRKFLQQTIQTLENLMEQFPYVALEDILAELQQQLRKFEIQG